MSRTVRDLVDQLTIGPLGGAGFSGRAIVEKHSCPACEAGLSRLQRKAAFAMLYSPGREALAKTMGFGLPYGQQDPMKPLILGIHEDTPLWNLLEWTLAAREMPILFEEGQLR